MCTVAVLQTADGLLLAGNRDERLTRPAAVPPAVQTRAGVRWLAPQDPEQGGTWITVNDRGLALSMLNNYQASAGFLPREPISRGQVVLALADCVRLSDVVARIRATFELKRVRPFVLVAAQGIGSHGRALTVRWDGAELTEQALALPGLVISNGGDFERATKARQAAFDTWLARGPVQPTRVLELFSSHEPTRGHDSICMHLLPFARTVSNTIVHVQAGGDTGVASRATMTYRAGSPCESGASVVSALELL